MEKTEKIFDEVSEMGKELGEITKKEKRKRNRFIELRKQYDNGISQKDFAKKLGLGAGKVSELESGTRTPSLNEALKYNSLTGASLDYLFDITPSISTTAGLTKRAVNNLERLRKKPEGDNAFNALNNLLSSPDVMKFLNLVHHLWISPHYSLFDDPDIFQGTPKMNMEKMLQGDFVPMAYAVRCNIERQILNYLTTHGIYEVELYEKMTAPDKAFDTDAGIDDLTEIEGSKV